MQLRNQIARYQKDHPTMRVYGTAAENSTFVEYIFEEKHVSLDDYTSSMMDSEFYGGAY